MAERLKARKTLNGIWKWKQDEWRKNVAIMKTRGFWCVQALWFAAGGLFLWILPSKPPDAEWTNYLLNQALICAIMLPIYFSEILSWSEWINRKTDKTRKPNQ